MFDALTPFDTIVVTGPQRSGTKIVAEIIAEAMDLRYVNESEYGVHCFERFWSLSAERAVVRFPADIANHPRYVPPERRTDSHVQQTRSNK